MGWKQFSQQFMHPEGFAGHIAGWLMAVTTSRRNDWTLAMLDIRPDDCVLEIGYGPGIGLKKASALATSGKVVGIDISDAMRQQAERRNRPAIEQGHVQLLMGDVAELSRSAKLSEITESDRPFDKIFSINSVMFWPDRYEAFTQLFYLLREGGALATTYQPFHKGASEADALQFAEEAKAECKHIGFSTVSHRLKAFGSRPAVCVLARK